MRIVENNEKRTVCRIEVVSGIGEKSKALKAHKLVIKTVKKLRGRSPRSIVVRAYVLSHAVSWQRIVEEAPSYEGPGGVSAQAG